MPIGRGILVNCVARWQRRAKVSKTWQPSSNRRRWRARIEAKLSVPAGTLTALQWNGDGELKVVIDRKDLAPL